MIERIKVISLDRTPDRFARFLATNPGLPIERVAATDGAALDRDALIGAGIITPDNRYKSNALGCMMSHLRLWQLCAAGSQPFHIAEDDVILRADFQAMAGALLARLGAWDMVLWAHNFDWPVKIRLGAGVGAVVMQYGSDPSIASMASFQSGTSPVALFEHISSAGTPCYSISPQGAARVIADCLPIGAVQAPYVTKPNNFWHNDGVDVELSRHYGNWRCYFAMPSLAVATNDQSASTIRGLDGPQLAQHLATMHDPAIANRAAR